MVEIRMPPDFPEHARLPLRELERRYNISATLARKWRLELGIKVPLILLMQSIIRRVRT